MQDNLNSLWEHKQTSERVYDGVLLHIDRDTVLLPDSSSAVRESVRHIGAVGIVAIDERGRIILENQFRYPVNDITLEIPAGKLDLPDEDRLSAAKRELREETGYTADQWISIGGFYPAPAYSDEMISLFLATGLHAGNTERDEDEFMEVVSIPFSDAIDLVYSGKISDAKTQIAILRATYIINV